nr:alkane hydroxylase MAH1-like [Ipomoea batatas]
MVSAEAELWELHRRTTTTLMNQANFSTWLERNVSEKMENGLFPVLDHYALQGTHFNLHEIFQKLAIDISCQQFLDMDPDSLTVDHPFRDLQDVIDLLGSCIVRNHRKVVGFNSIIDNIQGTGVKVYQSPLISKAASEQHISKTLTSHISPFPQSLTTGLHLQRPQSLTPSTAIKLQQTTQHDRRREEEKTMQHDSRRDDAAEIAPVAAVTVAVEIDQPLAHRCLPSPLSHRCLPPPQQKLMTNKKSAAFCLRVYPDCYEVSVQNT